MPSKNMIKKGKRRQTVMPAYRAHRDALREAADAGEQPATLVEAGSRDLNDAVTASGSPKVAASSPDAEAFHPELEVEDGVRALTADASASGKRLDAYLAKALSDISRARVQLLIDHRQIRVDGEVAKASLKLVGGERIEIEGEPHRAPLKAEPEDIPLTIVYEDEDLAVIDKPAGMTVHAGAGDAEHNRGTLVNALLFYFGGELAAGGDALRPGIVHRLDKETSGLILVAKNDSAHRKLSEMFAARDLRKVYLALVHGTVERDEGTVELAIGRDPVRRIRMTTRGDGVGMRHATSHWRVLERFASGEGSEPLGNFTLLEVGIETGRTHQIRVHLAALGHPVVGDRLYGAPAQLKPPPVSAARASAVDGEAQPTLNRNFLHAAELHLAQPRTGEALALRSPMPPELQSFLERLRPEKAKAKSPSRAGRVRKIEAR